MMVEDVSGFESLGQTWNAFWSGESTRPLLHAVAPKQGLTPIEKPNPYDCAFDEIDPIIDQLLGWAESHEFLGDTVPFFLITFAPDHFAALLGAEIRHGEGTNTNWVDPCIDTLAESEIRFRPEGRWWERTLECVERFRSACDGTVMISATHFQGGLDCLAAMYGTERLLLDIALDPERVRRALLQIDAAVADVRRLLAEAHGVSAWGSVNRFGMYSSGVIDVPQCDLSCMIARDTFDRIGLPSLARDIAGLDASVYHLDGPGALHQLEGVCAIEGLDVIQWMPGEGHYDDDWSEVNSRIDALGVGQIFQPFYRFSASDIVRMWERYRSRKLFFQVSPEVLGKLPWAV